MLPDPVLTAFCKPRIPLRMCPAAIHTQPGKRFPCLTPHNKSQWVTASSMKSHPRCITKRESQNFVNLGFSGHRTGLPVVSWRILCKGHQSPKLPGSCCEQSQLDSAPQETSAEEGLREQNVPWPSSPHASPPCLIHTLGRAAAVAHVQGNPRIRRLPESSPSLEWGHLPCT